MRHVSSSLLLLALAGCGQGPPAFDLATAKDRVTEASVAGRDKAWLVGQMDKDVRLGDANVRSIPAGPPSRVVFDVTLPREAKLSFEAGVDEKLVGRGSVEFVVKLSASGQERVVHHAVLDPTNRKQHRVFVPATVDLAAWSGKAVRLTFETSSQETSRDPRAAVWGNPVVGGRPGQEPLVVVYLVDTLRADHTSVYGYTRDTTPRLAAFAKDAVVFEQAVAQAAWTRPSVASLMTSLLPSEHGAVFVRDRLGDEVETLAERLEARGFATSAAVANTVVSAPRSGFEQGFHAFHDTKPVAAQTVDMALRLLDATRGRPTFLYVHTMDPHMPYAPPEPYLSMYDPKPTEDAPGRDPRHEKDAASKLASYVARYDGEVAYGDAEFGRFVDELKKRGLYERATIVFLADHGEELLDHGDWGHGISLFEELVHIPLLVKFPGGRMAGRRESRLAQEVDVLPTLLRESGAPPAERAVGAPLQALLAGQVPERNAILETSHRGHVIHGVRGPRDKYLRRFSPVNDEVYFELAQDPGEKQNRAGANAERVKSLRALIGPTLRPSPYRHVVRCVGPGAYDLDVAAAGWIEDVDATGLGVGSSAVPSEARDRVRVRCSPAAGAARDVSFLARPRGTRVTVTGTRDGRPLSPSDVRLGGEPLPVKELPAVLPNLDDSQTWKPFEPKDARKPGIYSWIEVLPGRESPELTPEAIEQMKALGYIQ